MNRLFLRLVILFTFLTSQSYALVCASSCMVSSEPSIENQHSDMPDCHSSKEPSQPGKDPETHSCSKTCQTDFLESQYTGIERSASVRGLNFHDSTNVRVLLLQLPFAEDETVWPKAPPPRWTYNSLILVQQKIII